MFDATSRYAEAPVSEQTLPDGRHVRYAGRRLLPQGSALPAVTTITVAGSERLDLIAERTLSDPGQFWRICDANDVMNPATALSRPGRQLRIPLADAVF